MASGVLFATGFDWVADVTNGLPYGWTAGQFNFVNSTYRQGTVGKGAHVFDTWHAGIVPRVSLATSYSHVVLQFFYRPQGTGAHTLVQFLTNSAYTEQIRVHKRTDSELDVIRGGTTIGTTSGAGLVTGAFHYLEIRLLVHDTTGEFEIAVNGTPVLQLTGVDTKDTAFNGCSGFAFQADGSGWRLDDVLFRDYSVVPSLIGTHIIRAQMPDGAGDSTQWTPDSGSNFARVNEIPHDSDTSYVESSTVGHKDLYTVADTSFSQGLVFAVQTHVTARKTDGATREIRPVIKHSTNEATGSTVTLGGAYTTTTQLWDDVPGGTGWTLAQFNALQAGIEVVT